MLRLIQTHIQELTDIRRKNRISFWNLQYMAADLKLFHLLGRENIIILLHQFGNRRNTSLRKRKFPFLRPVQLNLRSEEEILYSLSVRKILSEIDIVEMRASGKSIRFHFRQRTRQFKSKQTRRIPEALCFHSADSFRNFKPFTGFDRAERTIPDHCVVLQSGAAFLRTRHRL